jgi:LysR family transcriptional activator of nhaA
MASLNFGHLRYFHAIAHEKSLTLAAKKLHVSQSALSIQLKQLEAQLGHALFERVNRSLKLTEAGRMALAYADVIFQTGAELLSTLKLGQVASRRLVRVGSVATLSRNFQFAFLQPLLARDDVELVVRSGSERELLQQLHAHTIDLVLSNHPVRRDSEHDWHAHLIGEQPVVLVGPKPDGAKNTRTKQSKRRPFAFPQALATTPIVLPGTGSEMRAGFDRLLVDAGITPRIAAEVDDMAMLRLFARRSPGLTLLPAVVVRDELLSGALEVRCEIAELKERFYAITPSRKFPNPLVKELLDTARAGMMDLHSKRRGGRDQSTRSV